MARSKNNYIFVEQKPKKRAPGCLILLLAVIFAVIALSILSNSVLNQRIHLNSEKVRIMNMDSKYENVTILHISDLHGSELGFETEMWKDLFYGKGFTAVVMTGDMVGQSGDFAPLVSLIRALRQIKEDVPIYFVAGDEDPVAVNSTLHGSPEPLAEWVRAAQAEGAIYQDRAVGQTVGKKTVWFIPENLYSIGLTDSAGIKGMV
ncbi:MAG: metallophosphoesterase, partial [Firmicutes bacterium]|nr:metallophosphoesterase [Bacillota bacterium]